jgi:SNF2 family DNA or RNA helicase
VLDNVLDSHMRVIIFCFHLTFITSIEDHLHKRRGKFLYIGKNVDDEHKQDICDKFNNFDEYRAVLIDLSEDMTNIRFTVSNAVVLFAEVFWNTQVM